jgi:malonyl-CoA O-methyltransferase
MPDTAAASHRRHLDEAVVARWLQRQAQAAAGPWLHGEVARRMAERLPVILSTPEVLLQWWGHIGASDALLQTTYPKARRVLVEPSPALQQRSVRQATLPWWSARRWTTLPAQVCAEAEAPAAGAQLLWANMMLHAVADPPALMARWRRAITVDGFLMFSTLGPDTLIELRTLYRELGWGAMAPPFIDMHDLGDMLVQAGFADPVMDQEKLVLTWATPEAMLAELRGLGGNADPARQAGLRTPRWKRRLLDALRERAGPDGRLAQSFEIVYGHAFNPPPRHKVAAQTELPLADLRSMARAGARTPRKPAA